jgi:hypothetical protein
LVLKVQICPKVCWLPLWLSQPIWQNWKKTQTGATFLLLGFFAEMQKIKINLSIHPPKNHQKNFN